MIAEREQSAWERRFRAPTILFPAWSRHAPERFVYASTESGRSELHAWDLATGTRRRITDEAVGVLGGHASADGSRVLWLSDTTGDEAGRFVSAPFEATMRRWRAPTRSRSMDSRPGGTRASPWARNGPAAPGYSAVRVAG